MLGKFWLQIHNHLTIIILECVTVTLVSNLSDSQCGPDGLPVVHLAFLAERHNSLIKTYLREKSV